MADFLLEIGLEEVPARMIAGAQAELLKRTLALLTREQLLDPTHDDGAVMDGPPRAFSYSTPRRLAVLVENVLAHQSDITEEVTGPAVKIAFKDGQPTPAAEAFARKSGVAVADLKTIATPKGEYLAATVVKKGRSAAEVLAAELPKEIGALYWAKNMRWIPGSNERFVRPVLWLVCLLDEEIVPVRFGGKTAGRHTYGHRVLNGYAPMYITSASTWMETIQNIPVTYTGLLENMYVLVDVETRRQKIRKALDHATRAVPGARWREDEALVDTVTHLTEWPDVLLGSFESAYLDLPEEVLVTVMRDHQKYFAVEDSNGKLAPHFLTVTNIALDAENSATIRQGNERVLRARFNDARFFWEFDQRTPLVERVKLLENVTFQKDLGSYAKKSERVRELAISLAGKVQEKKGAVDVDALDAASRLAKTDLTTELVKEFTELQGIIGGLYAKSQGISEVAADAIYDQYLPSSAKDSIPRNTEGLLLGLADRMDTITGMFGLGMEPTGSKDPFALRRAANAVVRILAESNLTLTLTDLFSEANVNPQISGKLDTFFRERIEFYLREVRGNSYDVVAAVMLAGANALSDAVARAEAVTKARGSEDFLAVCAAFKRMKNIVAQAAEKDDLPAETSIEASAAHPAELALNTKAGVVGQQVKEFAERLDYVSALDAIATLRPEIDSFFDAVMVMDTDVAVRHRRLLMLQRLIRTFSGIADFSEIVTAG